MRYVSSVLFALSASLDALLTGLLLGLRKIRVPFHHNLLISLITLLGSFLAIRLGSSLTLLFSTTFLSTLEDIVGSSILFGMGAYYLIKALTAWSKERNVPTAPEKPPDKEASSVPHREFPTDIFLSRHKLLLLSFALSANNLGIGIGAGIAGLPLAFSCLLIFLLSFFLLFVGNLIGRLNIFRIPEPFSDLLCGLLLTILGIFPLL